MMRLKEKNGSDVITLSPLHMYECSNEKHELLWQMSRFRMHYIFDSVTQFTDQNHESNVPARTE